MNRFRDPWRSLAVLLYTAKHLLLKLGHGNGLVVSNFQFSKITKLA
jgi:hypothetical protein